MKYCANCKHAYLIHRMDVVPVYGCHQAKENGDDRLAQEMRKGECGEEAKLWEKLDG